MSLRALTWTVAVLAAVVLVGCDETNGADASNDPTSVTTASMPETSAITQAETSTTTPVDFGAELAALEQALEDADGDLCSLVKVTARPLNLMPTDEEQTEVVVDMLVEMVESMGRVAEPGDAQHYEDAAERLRDEAEENDYDPEWLTGPETFQSLDDPEFFEASGRLQARYKEQCTAPATTAPAG